MNLDKKGVLWLHRSSFVLVLEILKIRRQIWGTQNHTLHSCSRWNVAEDGNPPLLQTRMADLLNRMLLLRLSQVQNVPLLKQFFFPFLDLRVVVEEGWNRCLHFLRHFHLSRRVEFNLNLYLFLLLLIRDLNSARHLYFWLGLQTLKHLALLLLFLSHLLLFRWLFSFFLNLDRLKLGCFATLFLFLFLFERSRRSLDLLSL